MPQVIYEQAKTTVKALPPAQASVFVQVERARTRERNRPSVAKQPAVVYLTTYAQLNITPVSQPARLISNYATGTLTQPVQVQTSPTQQAPTQQQPQNLIPNPYTLVVGTTVKSLSSITRKTRVALIIAASTNKGTLWLVSGSQGIAGQGVPILAGQGIAIGNEAMTDKTIDLTKVYLVGTDINDTAYILELYTL